MENQYDGADIHARVRIVAVSRTSGVIYRNCVPLTCTFSTVFFGLMKNYKFKKMNSLRNVIFNTCVELISFNNHDS